MKKCFVSLIFCSFFLCGCSFSTSKITPERKSYISTMVTVYQEDLNSIHWARKGNCPMYPSCSAYAKEAFSKYSFEKAYMMSCERLIRCGRSCATKLQIVKKGQKLRYYDPVP